MLTDIKLAAQQSCGVLPLAGRQSANAAWLVASKK